MSDTESRLEILERALVALMDSTKRDRAEIQALRIALASLTDSLRPKNPQEAEIWLDDMQAFALENVNFHADQTTDNIILAHGVDHDRLHPIEEGRETVEDWLLGYYSGLKVPLI